MSKFTHYIDGRAQLEIELDTKDVEIVKLVLEKCLISKDQVMAMKEIGFSLLVSIALLHLAKTGNYP